MPRQVAFHAIARTPRHPVEQRTDARRRWRWRGRRWRGWRSLEYAADGCRKTHSAKRTGNTAQFAAAQAYCWTAPSTRHRVNRGIPWRRIWRIFTVVTKPRRRFFFILHFSAALDCRPCWRCVRTGTTGVAADTEWSQQLQNDSAFLCGDCHF